MQKSNKKWLIVFLTAAVLTTAAPWIIRAATMDELKKQIETKSEEIKRLEEEANKYRAQIKVKQEMGKTLKTELNRIDQTIKGLRSDIALTERKIQKTSLEVEKITFEMREKEAAIQKLKYGLAALMQSLSEKDKESYLAILIKNSVLSDFFKQLDYLNLLEKKVLNTMDDLRVIRKELEEKKTEMEGKKKELASLKESIQNQKENQEDLKENRQVLLKTTKNQEKNYQQLLLEQEKKRMALEDEIRAIEAKIRVTIDSSLLPVKGRGILGLVLPKMSLSSCLNAADERNCITQYFGYTSFAAGGNYNGKGHNGVDFRAPIGVEVFSAENGTIAGVGDTDIGCRKASYGKWILISHPNNLSTLYAHLSQINVITGQKVNRGERIGFSGQSGYATGPHLHLSVFATQAVKIDSIQSRVCGRLMTLPIAALEGYLNPLDYL